MGIKKRKISGWFRIRWKSFEKMHQKKTLAKVWRKNALFSLLLLFVKLVLLITFLVHFLTIFQRIQNQLEILRLFRILGHISTFWKLWSQTCKKWIKNLFGKCVLDFNFAPIKESVSSFSKKNQILCTLVAKWWCCAQLCLFLPKKCPSSFSCRRQ